MLNELHIITIILLLYHHMMILLLLSLSRKSEKEVVLIEFVEYMHFNMMHCGSERSMMISCAYDV